MKKALFVLAFVTGMVSLASAQTKAALTVTIKTPTVQCETCKHKIENTLAREEGIAKTVVNYKNKTTKVTYWTDRTNVENIKAAIANAGYDADDVTASEEAYKKLPLCCKKPADGGGPMKKN
ncbi:MAG: cation transporter [Chitinophagaceae bacterium]